MLPQNPTTLTGCVIGARGSVGRICAIGLAHTLGRLLLVGRSNSLKLMHEIIIALLETVSTTKDDILPGSVLDKSKRWLDKADLNSLDHEQVVEQLVKVAADIGLESSDDYHQALAKADFTVSATSEGKPFLSAREVKDGAVVFDTARPFDFIRDGHSRVLEGGLVKQPQDILYSESNIVRVPDGTHLACLSETIAIALEGMSEHQSIGKKIDYNHALIIFNIARKHGFLTVDYAFLYGDGK